MSASHDDLVLEHGDLERRRRQLERDKDVLQQTIRFQNQQIFQFEDIIGTLLLSSPLPSFSLIMSYLLPPPARKDREIENLMRDNMNQMWQLPREIEQTLHKLRVSSSSFASSFFFSFPCSPVSHATSLLYSLRTTLRRGHQQTYQAIAPQPLSRLIDCINGCTRWKVNSE